MYRIYLHCFLLLLLVSHVCLGLNSRRPPVPEDDDEQETRTSAQTSSSTGRTMADSPTTVKPATSGESSMRKEKEEAYNANKNQLTDREELDQRYAKKFEQVEKNKMKDQNMELYYSAVALLSESPETAINMLRESADKYSNPAAMYSLGEIYETGKYGLEIDFERAFYYYNISATLGHAGSQRELGFMYDTGIATQTNKALALLYYSFAARSQDIEAYNVLAHKYYKGYGVTRSCSMAAMNFRPVAEHVIKEIEERKYDLSGSAHVQLISDYFEVGRQIDKVEETIEYIQYSASNGDAAAQLEMGIWYLQGAYNIPRDYEVAMYFFELAAEQGDPKALAYSGYMYEEGKGVQKDIEKALALYRAAVRQGNAEGMYRLGMCYLNAVGVDRSYQEAFTYFKKASSALHIESMFELGLLYYHGLGVARSYETAFSHFRNAATVDHAKSQLMVAKMLQFGIGTVEDCQTAVEWYRKIVTKGSWRADHQTALELLEDKDYGRSLLIFEKLSERGFQEAQSNVAWMYDHNYIDPQFLAYHMEAGLESSEAYEKARFSLALKYHRYAADLGSAYAHLKLGDYYYYGLGGVEVDFETAGAYYRHVSSVSSQARFNLAYMHQHGIGLTKDLPLAKRYYDMALEANADGVIPVYLGLTSLGVQYGMEMYDQGKVMQAIEEGFEYFFPWLFYVPEKAAATTSVPTPNSSPTLHSSVDSWLDSESHFGYNWDTVIITALAAVLTVLLLVRNNIIQFQVRRM